MTFDKKDEYLEVEFNDSMLIESIKGKTTAKDFNKQMKQLRGMFEHGKRT